MTSKQPPIIGISCGGLQAAHGQHPPRVVQNLTYVNALVRAGAAPLLLPNVLEKDLLRALYQNVDGLLLSGGGDVAPARYGEAVHEKCGRADADRDEAELTLIRWAVEEGKPLLAICRGIQVLNVALGGSLYQDIGSQVPDALDHTWYPDHPRHYLAHTVSVAPATRLAQILATPSLPVNSLHHQAIKELASSLIATACAPDEIIEAVEMPSHSDGGQSAGTHPFAVGVQWHPEDLAPNDARQQGLFDSLVESCRR
jgi:putative glutamine amidotransferase